MKYNMAEERKKVAKTAEQIEKSGERDFYRWKHVLSCSSFSCFSGLKLPAGFVNKSSQCCLFDVLKEDTETEVIIDFLVS